VELDIHLTADRKVILSHDETTSRTTGGTSMVIAETSASALQKLDVGSWKGAKFAGEKMPLLEEMLAELPKGVRAFVEFKSGGDGAVEVRDVVEKSGKRAQVTFISFGLDTITEVKRTMPDRPAYWLRGTEKDKETGKVIPHGPELIRQAKERGLDGLDLNYGGITAEFVKEAKAAGLEVHAWTVNYADEAARLRDIGVDSITTDRPDMVLEVVRGKKQ
jgi:glycerophosphoryl diester phosphodiesterase